MNLKLGIVAAIVLCGLASARADELVIKRSPPYAGVSILEAKDGMITFRLSTGGTVTKSVADIQSVALKDHEDLATAEKALADNKLEPAVKAYGTALGKVKADTWTARLIRYRRLAAMEQGKMIERAVPEWLAMVDESAGKAEVLALRPKNLPARGAKENAAAITALEGYLPKAKDATLAAVKQALLDLYTMEGQSAKAAAIAGEIASAPVSGDTPKNGGEVLEGQIKAADALLQNGDPAKAVSTLQGNIDRYSGAELASAMLVLGKAQLALAEKAKDDAAKRPLLLDAGLNLMRVYTYYASLSEAGEALYYAGKVNEALGNNVAARTAYTRVTDRYGKSEAASKAQAALAALK